MSELISSTNEVTDVNGMFSRLLGVGPLRNCAYATAVEEVGRDERAEEQALRREEHPDRQLVVADAGVRLVRVGVRGDRRRLARGDDCLRHQWCSSVAGSIVHALRPKNATSAPIASSQYILNTKP